METLILANERLTVGVEPARGADVVTLVHRASGVDVLFSTPWRARAEAVRSGVSAPTTTDPVAGWLEQYPGGWQTLCPNAGPPRDLAGAPAGFHGEASLARWNVTAADDTRARLHTELFSVPVLIERELKLRGNTLTSVDTLRNLSRDDLELDYASHPAFGGRLLDGRCTVDTGARRLVTDPDTPSTLAEPGSSHIWPWLTAPDGTCTDLRAVPPADRPRTLFGWLTDFSSHWAALTNVDLGLTVRLEWDGTHLPHAWFWQELGGSPGFPWYRRARVVAIEPSSTQTSGPERRSVLRLGPEQALRIPLSMTVTTRKEPQA